MKNFLEIFKFELRYRAKRPATYIYFLIMLALCVLAVTTNAVTIGGGVGQVKQNAPVVISRMMLVMSAFMMMITSAIMGVAVLRDFDHQTESMMFTNPITKGEYLLGRFAGSFVVLIFVFSGMVLGLMLGQIPFFPWSEPDKLLPFNFITYWNPFIYLVIPNLFITGVLFFLSGALSRKIIVVYTQGILLFILYQIAFSFVRDLENTNIAALIDPFGINTTSLYTQYWTVAERNSLQIPFEGNILINRLLWVAIGFIGLFITYLSFSFNVVRSSFFKKKKVTNNVHEKTLVDISIPLTGKYYGIGAQVQQLIKQSGFYFRMVFKELPFLAMVICGLALLFINSYNMDRIYGADIYPTTYAIIEMISGSFTLFFIIIIVFYSGELIWKERNVKMNLIYDAMPIPDFLNLISKFFGMILTYVALIFILIGAGILVQTLKGYYNYELSIYLTSFFSSTISFLVLYTFLSFFVHVMVNHKFIGHAVIIVFFVATLILETIGVEHSLLQFGSASLGTYSDMNGYGHFVTSFSWMDFYWFAFAVILFSISVVFAVRGSESILKTRWNVGKLRLTKPLLSLGLISLMSFTLSGCYIYYNTNVLNDYSNSDDIETVQANYEKQLKKYQYILKPKIIDTYVNVDLYPETRDFTAEGYYILKNKTNKSIKDIHIQGSSDQNAKIKKLEFQGGAKVKENFDEFRYTIYELTSPLMPGDSIRMDFITEFNTVGFVESGSSTNVVYNGTFFNNSIFPTMGYNSSIELSDPDTRKEQELPLQDELMDRDDPKGIGMSVFGDNADYINFEIIMSTAPDQIAIAPGYLQKEWEENGRRYFHYKMDKPMINLYSMVSARYEVKRDVWIDDNGNEVNLEIYYHKGHEYNLDNMMKAMKKSFDYYTENFSPYQFRQMRIMEFPRYAEFAASFANTVPFSEGIGFNLNIKDEDVDMAYYVTAHEMGHQWWAHQVTQANVKGSPMVSETLSQYSALMVMKQEYPEEMMQKFLKHELDRYLRGRTTERKKELPLEVCERQGYIYYRKGSLIMYALQDYISEDSVNSALRRCINDWAYRDDKYITTKNLVNYFKEVTPDSLQYVIHDMFETITLFENKTDNAEYEKLPNGKYKVELTVSAKKLRADSLGVTNEVPLTDWIDIGIYGKGESEDKDKLLYIQKHKIDANAHTFTIVVDEMPVRAGIDPINKLIDRNPKDNTKKVFKKVES